MKADDTVDNSKAYPCALKLCLRMKSVEGPKHLLRILLVEPDAVVPDIINDLTILLDGPEFHAGVLRLRGEFPGVPEQVRKDDLDQPRVCKDCNPILDVYLDAHIYMALA